MLKRIRALVLSLFFAETLLLANGLLLVRLAQSLSTPPQKGTKEAVLQLPRTISAKLSFGSMFESPGVVRQSRFRGSLPVIDGWESIVWVNGSRVTDDPVSLFSGTVTGTDPEPIPHDDGELTITRAMNTAESEHHLGKLSSFLTWHWTETQGSNIEIRVLSKLKLDEAFIDWLSKKQYSMIAGEAWNSIARNKPADDWERFLLPESARTKTATPSVRVTVQPEAVRTGSMGQFPMIRRYERGGSIVDAIFSPPASPRNIYVEPVGKPLGTFETVIVETIVRVKTPDRAGEEPEVRVLIWPATADAWPAGE